MGFIIDNDRSLSRACESAGGNGSYILLRIHISIPNLDYSRITNHESRITNHESIKKTP